MYLGVGVITIIFLALIVKSLVAGPKYCPNSMSEQTRK
jgi:hypothetical protein